MTKYDFNQPINRLNTSSVKWELTKEIFGTSDILPMWVADMDFAPPIEVKEAIQNRVNHGIFGYTFAKASVSEAIQGWVKKRHGWDIELSWIKFHSGVVPAISTTIQALTKPGDKIMLQSPVYTPFFTMIEKNEREVVNCPLQLSNHRYEIDFSQMEECLQSGVKLFLLCNPHNPGGRAWTESELRQIAELCKKYHCLILSDEIHSDLIFKPNRHISIASLDESYQDFILTCLAPTKTFNIAGLQASAILIPNPDQRKSFEDTLAKQGLHGLNLFGLTALEASYRYGEEWLEQLLEYLTDNLETAKSFISKQIPEISLVEPDGTYLLWLDCRKLGLSDLELKNQLLQKGKLGLEPGPKFGPGGEGFVRMNIACTKATLLDGLERLKLSFS
ncbi:MalY/PatB family protein [Cytobacillus sp. Hz8]|uniref:MalY/PatB family protein n=1 Tax=Cytobacillus sp. Hz8 TaxID=3347168 RepID=UPI0035DB231C